MAKVHVFEAALNEARKALADALEERGVLEDRIVCLKRTIATLEGICEPEPQGDSVEIEGGFFADTCFVARLTDAVRQVFAAATKPLTPPEVRDALLTMGVNLAKYKQPLVPIHNTLKRLESQGEIVSLINEDGKLCGYRWVIPLARAVAEVENHPIMKLKGRRPYLGTDGRLESWQAVLGVYKKRGQEEK